MAQVINTNTMSLNAQRNLGTSGANLATTIQRLSSGMRINSAKDDAAGLAISERFTTQIRGANQAARNANDGISLAQTAEGALGEIGNNLQRVRELAVQSRSATNSDSDRQALNAEVQLLKQEIQRVAEQTNFNGTNLLDGTFTSQAFQIGANQGQTINISQVANANISKLGNWTSASTSASISGELPTLTKSANSGVSGAFATATAGAVGEKFTLTVGTTKVVDVTAAAIGDKVDAAAIDTALATTATKDALAAEGIKVSGSATAGTLAFTKADGTDLNVTLTNNMATLGGFANAGFVATHEASLAGAKFGAIDAGQLKINGVDIKVDEAKTASDRATALANAVNAQTHKTGVSASLIEGKLQLTSKDKDFSIESSLNAADLKAATGLATANTASSTGANIQKYDGGTAVEGFAGLDISSVKGADDAILAMDAALNSINSARADLGAIQNRFTSVVANLNTSSENMSAARSRIRDVDYASETAELTRNQILQQAGTAMLAQANQSSQNVLSLLR